MRSEIAAESSHHLPSATIPTHATGVVWTDSGYLLNGLAIQVLAIDLQKTIINLDFACDKNVRIFVDHYAAAKYSNRNCTIPCNGGVARLVTSLCKVSRELMNSVRNRDALHHQCGNHVCRRTTACSRPRVGQRLDEEGLIRTTFEDDANSSRRLKAVAVALRPRLVRCIE